MPGSHAQHAAAVLQPEALGVDDSVVVQFVHDERQVTAVGVRQLFDQALKKPVW
jgi:hypothetical protein